MDTWTLQTGFPEVTVTRNYTTKQIDFRQHRFVYVNHTNKNRLLGQKSESPLWWVPLSYTTAIKKNFADTKPSEWMRKEPMLSMRDSSISDSDWILVNIQQTGTFSPNGFHFEFMMKTIEFFYEQDTTVSIMMNTTGNFLYSICKIQHNSQILRQPIGHSWSMMH